MVEQFLANESANERTPNYSVIDDDAQVAPSAHFASMVSRRRVECRIFWSNDKIFWKNLLRHICAHIRAVYRLPSFHLEEKTCTSYTKQKNFFLFHPRFFCWSYQTTAAEKINEIDWLFFARFTGIGTVGGASVQYKHETCTFVFLSLIPFFCASSTSNRKGMHA